MSLNIVKHGENKNGYAILLFFTLGNIAPLNKYVSRRGEIFEEIKCQQYVNSPTIVLKI